MFSSIGCSGQTQKRELGLPEATRDRCIVGNKLIERRLLSVGVFFDTLVLLYIREGGWRKSLDRLMNR